jgi:AAA-like domain
MEKQAFATIYDQLTRKQKVYLQYFLQGLSDEEIIEKPNTGGHSSTIRFHLGKIANQFDFIDDYRENLVRLFGNHMPSLVSPDVLEKYGFLSRSSIQAPTFEESLEYPDGFVPIGSPFYLSPIVQSKKARDYCAEKLSKGSTLLRINAPRKFGKTSLVERLLKWGEKKGYEVVRFDLHEIDGARLNDLEALLKMLCMQICREMHIETQFDIFWDQRLDAIAACKYYFEGHLLRGLEKPLLLGLDNVDRLFACPQLYDFFRMLRIFHNESKQSKIWKNLRCIITYSTGLYIKLDMNQSPFNVGEDITFPAFSAEQVKELARRHNLWEFEQSGAVEALMKLVEGQPYLVRLALYDLAQGQGSLVKLLESAVLPQGIYQAYLQGMWHQINQEEEGMRVEILTVLRQLVASGEVMRVSDEAGYKLKGMGIVDWMPSGGVQFNCEMYRQYFQRRFALEG